MAVLTWERRSMAHAHSRGGAGWHCVGGARSKNRAGLRDKSFWRSNELSRSAARTERSRPDETIWRPPSPTTDESVSDTQGGDEIPAIVTGAALEASCGKLRAHTHNRGALP